jgi:hypothetical protein
MTGGSHPWDALVSGQAKGERGDGCGSSADRLAGCARGGVGRVGGSADGPRGASSGAGPAAVPQAK